MYAAIRIRGKVGMKKEIEDTLKMLKLNKKMHCVLVNDDKVMTGMLRKAKDFITWGEINDDVLRAMLEKRGRKPGNKRVDKGEAEAALDKIKSEGKIILNIKPVFRLTPPSKGFKYSIKQHFPKGELGYRGDKINDLIKRMI